MGMAARDWNGIPRAVVESKSLELSKESTDVGFEEKFVGIGLDLMVWESFPNITIPGLLNSYGNADFGGICTRFGNWTLKPELKLDF